MRRFESSRPSQPVGLDRFTGEGRAKRRGALVTIMRNTIPPRNPNDDDDEDEEDADDEDQQHGPAVIREPDYERSTDWGSN
jgi:hypothetical protein